MENISALKFAGVWKQVKELVALVNEKLADALRK
jgi:hypothetical protein